MSILRIAQYTGDADTSEESIETWDSIIGEHLRSVGGCLSAVMATDGHGGMAVVTEWENEEAYDLAMNSPAYEEASRRIIEAFGIEADSISPDSLFVGSITTRAV